MTGLGEDGGDADSRCCLQGEEVAACHDGLTVRASAEDACTLAEVKEEMVVLVRPSRTIPLS